MAMREGHVHCHAIEAGRTHALRHRVDSASPRRRVLDMIVAIATCVETEPADGVGEVAGTFAPPRKFDTEKVLSRPGVCVAGVLKPARPSSRSSMPLAPCSATTASVCWP